MSLTFKEIETEVRRLAAENPDFVYSTPGDCFYNPTELDGVEHEACIFGQAFRNLGEPLAKRFEGVAAGGVLEDLGMARDQSKEYRWANWVQEFQDQGFSWAHAVSRGDEMSPLS